MHLYKYEYKMFNITYRTIFNGNRYSDIFNVIKYKFECLDHKKYRILPQNLSETEYN